MTEDPSKRIGDYEVLGVLGAGGMGKVFKVRNVISDRIEAMKILLPDLEGRQELADRFLREIKLLASLDHPNIAQLRTALTLSNRLVMVMEYVEGTTLAARLEQGPIPANETLGYVSQVLSALSYAHSRGVIHRDIKPGNMMLTPNGTVKLMDFGIARAGSDPTMTVTGTTIGSLFYMSPEQVKGGAVDNRSDLYSLGISLYEMVTGQLPFKTGSDYSLMTAQLQERPKPPSELRPDLPPQLNGVILHSMAKEPTERFQSADEFRESLEAIRKILPAPAAVIPAVAAPMRPIPGSASRVAEPPITAATSVFTGSPTAGLSPTASQISPVPSAPPPPAPAPVPSVMDLSPKPSKGRGLYMALGAAVVLIVLVLAGISLPRLLKTRANEQKQNEQKQSADQSASSQSTTQSPTTPNPPSSNPNSSPNPSAPGPDAQSASSAPDSTKSADAGTQASPESASSAAQPPPSADTNSSTAADNSASASAIVASNGKSKSGKKGKSKTSTATSTSTSDQGSAMASGDQSAATTQRPETVEEVEQDVDQTSSRASAANSTLDTMRHSLAGQGLNLRGDIASSQELMKTNLDRAQQALQNHDTKNARRYLNIAQAEMEKIEKFLGH